MHCPDLVCVTGMFGGNTWKCKMNPRPKQPRIHIWGILMLPYELMVWLKHILSNSYLIFQWVWIIIQFNLFTSSVFFFLSHLFLLTVFLNDHGITFLLFYCRTFPIRGFQIYDGPVRLTQSTFRGFMPTPERYTSAVGFNLKNTWQLTPRNNLSQLNFHSTVSKYLVLI